MACAEMDCRFKSKAKAYQQDDPNKKPELQLHVPIDGRTKHSDDK